MLIIENLSYKSPETIIFQRSTVLVTEIVFFAGAFILANSFKISLSQKWIVFALTVSSPGIFYVDNIHFQYNSFMYGLQLLSIACFIKSKYLLGGVLFAVVLNFKHIYLYQAPPYFIYLLSVYCFPSDVASKKKVFNVIQLIKIGIVTIFIFAISFGLFYDHIPQVLSRLFDFKRGLCHAYWAPNVWAVYSFLDRVLLKLSGIFFGYTSESAGHLTRGLVGDTSFAILPEITPLIALILTVSSQLPILFKLWINPTADVFLDALVLSSFSSFLFSWFILIKFQARPREGHLVSLNSTLLHYF
jgi:alpha-1,3-glucosyltransferase